VEGLNIITMRLAREGLMVRDRLDRQAEFKKEVRAVSERAR
jgi:hypothetical protein